MSEDTSPIFNIVLYHPEIPNNTGNIGRICLAANCHLHLIGPLGFSIDQKEVKRAGLDYWEHVQLTYYSSFDDFVQKQPFPNNFSFLTTKTDQAIYDKKFRKGDWFMFGPETTGLPEEMWRSRAAQSYTIPMIGPTRSLNLANAVSIVTFEGLRQLRERKDC